MIFINCPNCGERNEEEFVYGGDAARKRPADPDLLSDAEWNDYIYSIPNTKGWAQEHWWHVRGCSQWILIERNSADNTLREASIKRNNV